jgi:phenylpropionate dioxygenase-like ring-hydroxylating dioxygenase large terminal subunit
MILLNSWYAVALASGLKQDQPLRITLHGSDLVLWRDASGKAIAAKDRCPHKGASLSRGCVVEGRLLCGYHGWSFDSDGRCVDIPANREGMAIPRRATLDGYPCKEAHGFLWLWWHDQPDLDPQTVPPLPPISHIPDEHDAGWRSMEGKEIWSAHWLRILEGFVDLTHVPFVHKGTFGGAAADQLYTTAEETTEHGIYALIDTPRDTEYRSKQSGNLLKRLAGGLFRSKSSSDEAEVVGSQHVNVWLANLLFIRVVFKDFSIYLCLVPVPLGDGRTELLWRHFRSFLKSPLADGAALKRVHRFLEEDRGIVESVTPSAPDLDNRADLLLASDSTTLALRKLLREKRDANLLR